MLYQLSLGFWINLRQKHTHTIVVRNFMCIEKSQSSQQGTYIWINTDYLDLGDDAIKHIVVLFLRKKNASRVMHVAININGHQRIDNLH
jgi:hypothetical protein